MKHQWGGYIHVLVEQTEISQLEALYKLEEKSMGKLSVDLILRKPDDTDIEPRN